MPRRTDTNAKGSSANSDVESNKKWWLDSVTNYIAAGFYRIEVLDHGQSIAEYFVVKGYPKKTYWCVLSSSNRLETHHLFKTLRDARDFCVFELSR